MLKRPPLYFNAFREEPYVTGGEEYLTFTDCSVNAGEAFFPKSGIFLAPYPGIGCGCSYFLTLSPHSCMHTKAGITEIFFYSDYTELYNRITEICK